MTTNGKGAFINDVSKDRLWRDYVSREENHQNYWAVEAQFVKGSLSPDKKNILRAVDSLTEFDPSSLLGTARGSQPSSPTARFGGTTSSAVIGSGSVLNPNPNAPSNLLLRQLHMTAAENTQAEAKQLEQLQSFKHNYSTRAGQLKDAEAKEAKKEDGSAKLSPLAAQQGRVNSDASLSPLSNRQTPLSPNATLGAASTASLRYPSELQKERTLNNNYCSYYAGKDIGIHHYKYSPPARSCQGLVDANHTANEEGGSLNNTVTSNLIGSGSHSRHTSASPNNATNKKSLPPLATHLLQSALPPLEGSPMSTTRRLMSPVNSSRVYHEELEEEARLVSPKRHYTEHGLLQPVMGRRVAGTTAHRGYGQRIASSHEVAFAVRPTVELNERSTHGYRKW